MTLEELLPALWKAVNEPFSILIIGSGLGWLFIKLWWEPFKRREAEAQRREAIRREVEIRIFSIKEAVKHGH